MRRLQAAITQGDVTKRRRTARLEGRSIDSAFHEFRVDYEQTKHLAVGEAIFSDSFSSGGYMWRIGYFPHGPREEDNSYISLFFDLLSKASVDAICEAFIKVNDHPWPQFAERTLVQQFQADGHMSGWPRFISQSDLEKYCLKGGHAATFVCSIMVVHGSSIPVPASDMGKHFGALLDSMDGADVSFTVDGETFRAHRAVLAARSPVFRAELLGSMAEAAMPNITISDIAPATFRIMLRFMYTDALPADNELGGSDHLSEMMRHLLAAADRYVLDRLKLICAQKLWEDVSVDTAADTLSFAEMHSCPELKNKCMDFFATGENFKKAVLTKGFVQLVQQFPSSVDELRKRIGL